MFGTYQVLTQILSRWMTESGVLPIQMENLMMAALEKMKSLLVHFL
jgi:hypothetical protein